MSFQISPDQARRMLSLCRVLWHDCCGSQRQAAFYFKHTMISASHKHMRLLQAHLCSTFAVHMLLPLEHSVPSLLQTASHSIFALGLLKCSCDCIQRFILHHSPQQQPKRSQSQEHRWIAPLWPDARGVCTLLLECIRTTETNKYNYMMLC